MDRVFPSSGGCSEDEMDFFKFYLNPQRRVVVRQRGGGRLRCGWLHIQTAKCIARWSKLRTMD